MAKLVLADVSNLQNEASAIATLAANNRAIEAMIERLLNRDGLSPNQMTAELDMNSNRIINLPEPTSSTEPVRVADLTDLFQVVFGVIGWEWDADGRYLQSTGTFAGTAGATITAIDQFDTPFVGSVSADMRLGIGNSYDYNGGASHYLVNQINSYVTAANKVHAAAIVGTGVSLSGTAHSWGVAGVGASYATTLHSHAGEFNACAMGGSGLYRELTALALATGGDGLGTPSSFLWMAANASGNAAAHGIILRDEGVNPILNTGSLITTGFNAGYSGSAHLQLTHVFNFLNTAVSGRVLRHGTSTAEMLFLGGNGTIGFTGNAGLYAIDNGGTARRIIDHDSGSTLSRFYGPDGSTHVSMSTTQVYIDATTHNWRSNNGGTTWGTLSSSSLTLTVPLAISFANPAAGLVITATTGTNGSLMRFVNNLGSVYLGIDSSAGGLFGGISAYAMVFGTTGGGNVEFATSNVKRLTISANGNIVPGNSAALATTATDGFIYIQTCAGTPTGTPTAYTGRVATVFDTTNNRLYVYNGGWISVALA